MILSRRSLSLRTRLLAGLIALTAVFLVVMGAVTAVVLGTLDRNQLNAELGLEIRQSVLKISAGADGFAAAYVSLKTGASGDLTPGSPAASELRTIFAGVTGPPTARAYRQLLRKRAAAGQPFSFTSAGGPAMRAAWRLVSASSASASSAATALGVLPAGPAIIVVGRPVDASNVRRLVLAELVTGGALIALLVICGNWLIGRGLAPLGRMASAADMITRSGDLAARMPDPDDRHETGRLAGAINLMLDRIQQAFGARLRSEQKVRQFAADASHELRTPLTTIRGYAELYRTNALRPADLPNAMRRIEAEAERMSMLVAELLELARLDRMSSLDLTETDLAVLARDAVADARAVEPDREISALVPDSLVATADEPRVRQVLANLLGNVRAHTPASVPATVALQAEGDWAVLEVSDRGRGMSARDAARAFDRFYRGAGVLAAGPDGLRPAGPDGAGATGPDGLRAAGPDGAGAAGSGLGLSIVAAIAAAHGGRAEISSAPGKGTSVRLWIPVRNHPQS